MGIAILGVLVAHTIGLGGIEINNVFLKILNFFPRLVFTEGFLLLSGFGLYYSFRKEPNIKEFYLKRIKRLIIPFALLSAWYYAIVDLWQSRSIVDFLGHISSAAFWYEGNYNGMWYIAVSVVLYFLFPLIYRFVFRGDGSFVFKTSLVIVGMIILSAIVMIAAPNYFDRVSIGLVKLPMFVIGIAIGALSTRNILNIKCLRGGVCGCYHPARIA